MGGHASLALNALWKLKIALQWLNCSSVNSIVLAVLNTPFSTPSFFHSLSTRNFSCSGVLRRRTELRRVGVLAVFSFVDKGSSSLDTCRLRSPLDLHGLMSSRS